MSLRGMMNVWERRMKRSVPALTCSCLIGSNRIDLSESSDPSVGVNMINAQKGKIKDSHCSGSLVSLRGFCFY